ncbi:MULTISPECIES: hypothetical protein [Bacillus]|jgi:site-specific recombinase XerD|nr:hypothetical protein BSM4216_3376 [Bacillus smithii]MED1489721.1 hypothetical protein [Bacillus smithii]MED4882355.1 hypothetical protein [Bacillus smithii]
MYNWSQTNSNGCANAMIDLMLDAGLRVNEVAPLEINDIISKDKGVQV